MTSTLTFELFKHARKTQKTRKMLSAVACLVLFCSRSGPDLVTLVAFTPSWATFEVPLIVCSPSRAKSRVPIGAWAAFRINQSTTRPICHQIPRIRYRTGRLQRNERVSRRQHRSPAPNAAQPSLATRKLTALGPGKSRPAIPWRACIRLRRLRSGRGSWICR